MNIIYYIEKIKPTDIKNILGHCKEAL